MTPEQAAIVEISQRLIKAQGPIRILDAIKWDNSIKEQFFQNKCQKNPIITKEYYDAKPLPFNPQELTDEFLGIIRETKNKCGNYTVISNLIENRCQEYIQAIRMLEARGTQKFSDISMELYGAPNDAFYSNGPKLSELGEMLGSILKNLANTLITDADEKRYNAHQAKDILQNKLSSYFEEQDNIIVEINDNMVADAAAGADKIRLNSMSRFSDRDLRYLEVHEGWVHVGTTLNGLKQPYCQFLAKGSPASSTTQEGLAVITELFTFSSYPARLLKLTTRVSASQLVQDGAEFIEIFRFFEEQNYSAEDAYNFSVRVFRGSLPNLGPFTKDLSYARGFLLIYNYLRIAVDKDLLNTIAMFFVGKTLINEVQQLAKLHEEGLISLPIYMPPQFKDLAALSSWMSFSLYLNKFDMKALSNQFNFI